MLCFCVNRLSFMYTSSQKKAEMSSCQTTFGLRMRRDSFHLNLSVGAVRQSTIFRKDVHGP